MRQLQRQGDVLLIPIDSIPANATAVARDARGRIVLAEGERTGHAHCVLDDAATLFRQDDLDEMADRFLHVQAECGLIDAWRCRDRRRDIVCWMPAYQNTDRIEAADYAILAREDIPGVIVEHEEHLHFVVLPGDHIIRPKREYQPEAPRQVMD